MFLMKEGPFLKGFSGFQNFSLCFAVRVVKVENSGCRPFLCISQRCIVRPSHFLFLPAETRPGDLCVTVDRPQYGRSVH